MENIGFLEVPQLGGWNTGLLLELLLLSSPEFLKKLLFAIGARGPFAGYVIECMSFFQMQLAHS